MSARAHGERVFVRLMGCAWIAAGVLAEKSLFEWIYVAPGHLGSQQLAWGLRIFQLLVLPTGVALLCWPGRSALRWLARGSSIFVVLFLSLTFLDVLLDRLDYPQSSRPLADFPLVFYPVNNLEFTFHYETNTKGLRADEVPLPRRPNAYRMVVVGDSFVEGIGVGLEDTFPKVMQEAVERAGKVLEVVHCGMSGTAAHTQTETLIHLCLRYQPDLVLIAVYANDVGEMPEDLVFVEPDVVMAATHGGELEHLAQLLWPHIFRALTLVRQGAYADPPPRGTRVHSVERLPPPGVDAVSGDYLDRLLTETKALPWVEKTRDLEQQTREEATRRGFAAEEVSSWFERVPPQLVEASNYELFTPFFWQAGLFYPDFWRWSLDLAPPLGSAKMASLRLALSNLVQLCRERGIEVAATLIPAGLQVSPRLGQLARRVGMTTRDSWAATPTALELELARWARIEQVPFFDLTPTFREHESKDDYLYFPLDGHWTRAGHRLAGSTLAPWIDEMIPARPSREGTQSTSD